MFFTYVWIYLLVANIVMMYFSHKKKQRDIQEHHEANQKKNVLYVLAHPDDESMFFVPVIRSMKEMGYKLHIICLSNGRRLNFCGLKF
jgi:N-acetylglucosaminylphosphatidylinositol deacetylase